MEENIDKWLEKAEHDYSSAEINLKQKVFDVSSFLSHQAAEKALKALYIHRKGRLWKIHDLVKLSRELKASKKIASLCEKLNPHYLASRYPLDVDYTGAEASEALESSKEVMEWVKKEMAKLKK